MFPKAIASLVYALSAYKRFQRDTLVLDSRGKSVLWIMLQWTLEHVYLFKCFLSYNNSMFSFCPKLFSMVFSTPFYIHTSNTQEFQFLHILAKVCSFFFFLIITILIKCIQVFWKSLFVIEISWYKKVEQVVVELPCICHLCSIIVKAWLVLFQW